jgi:hypothetical protein
MCKVKGWIPSRAQFGRHGGRVSQSGELIWVSLGLNQDDPAIDGQGVEEHGEAGAVVVRKGDTDAQPDRLLAY